MVSLRRVSTHDSIWWYSFIWMLTKACIGWRRRETLSIESLTWRIHILLVSCISNIMVSDYLNLIKKSIVCWNAKSRRTICRLHSKENPLSYTSDYYSTRLCHSYCLRNRNQFSLFFRKLNYIKSLYGISNITSSFMFVIFMVICSNFS